MPFKIANPLRLNQQDVARLPIHYLVLVSILYILAGLTWRDVWRQEAASFATMLTMAQGGLNDWLYPNIAGQNNALLGPLPYWLGALSIKLLNGFMSPFCAAQVAIAAQNAASIYLLWLTVYRLGKRPELQPQRLAFGGEPSEQDYGRMLADSAALLYISTYGIAAHTHDTSEGATLVFACLLWLCGAVSSLERPLMARWLWALGLTAMGLSLPFSLFIFFTLTTLGILFSPYWRNESKHSAPVVMLLGLLLPFAWLYQVFDNPSFLNTWLTHQHFSPLSASNLRFFIRNLPIFAWPIAPLAVWCLWRWRIHWMNPMMFLNLIFLLTPTLHLIITGLRFEMSMLIFLPALLLLAPFGLATLNRGRANIIDWFSVVTFSLLAIGVWLMWIASWIGFPPQWAHNIYKLAPAYTPNFKWWPFIIAFFITIAWIALLFWRSHHDLRALWKSVVFSSCGLVLVWSLLATLGMPWLDYTRNYVLVGQAIADKVPADTSCVRGFQLSGAARGAIYYYAHIPFVPTDSTFDHVTCPYIITHETALNQTSRVQMGQNISLIQTDWQVIWLGERIAERDNQLVLLRQQ